MVGLRREQVNISLGKMIGDTRKEDILSFCVNELVQCRANANNTVEGLRQIRDHVRKALGEENTILPCLFLCDPFLGPFLNVKTGSQPK